jgi:dolichol-phosphate mannosyltransferase subunit 3
VRFAVTKIDECRYKFKKKRKEKHTTMGLLRYQLFLSHGISWLAVWIVLMKQQQDEANFLLKFAPIWAIIVLGMYLLIRLIVGVRSFKDCPEEARELLKDILEGEREMRKKGIIK